MSVSSEVRQDPSTKYGYLSLVSVMGCLETLSPSQGVSSLPLDSFMNNAIALKSKSTMLEVRSLVDRFLY